MYTKHKVHISVGRTPRLHTHWFFYLLDKSLSDNNFLLTRMNIQSSPNSKEEVVTLEP